MSNAAHLRSLLRPFLLARPRCQRSLLVSFNADRRCFSKTRPLLAAVATSSTSSKLSGPPPFRTTTVLFTPTKQALDDADIDAELIPPDEARLVITDRAAELRHISTRENDPNLALRIIVESGGCHGYQYKMLLTSERQTDDYTFSHPSIKPSNILVDAVSLPLVKGSTLDFATELIGSTFRIASNPQAKGSGCGCGVSWELKV